MYGDYSFNWFDASSTRLVNVFVLLCFTTEWARQRPHIMFLGRVRLLVLSDSGLSVLLMTCVSDYFSIACRLHAKHDVSNATGFVGCLPSMALGFYDCETTNSIYYLRAVYFQVTSVDCLADIDFFTPFWLTTSLTLFILIAALCIHLLLPWATHCFPDVSISRVRDARSLIVKYTCVFMYVYFFCCGLFVCPGFVWKCHSHLILCYRIFSAQPLSLLQLLLILLLHLPPLLYLCLIDSMLCQDRLLPRY